MKKLRIVLLTLFILVIAFSVIYFFLAKKNIGDLVGEPLGKKITINKALQIAQANLGVFYEWKGPVISQNYAGYDLQGKETAFFFLVTDLYGKAGFIAINANTNVKPVIEISFLPVDPLGKLKRFSTEVSIGTLRGPNEIRTEVIYLGGRNYYGKMTFRESEEVVEKYYDLSFENPQEISLEEMQKKAELFPLLQDTSAAEEWNKYK